MADGRVLIALAAGPLVAEPTWTRFDEDTACRCAGFDWTRGRQSEFDVSEAGSARVYFHDRDGSLSGEDLVGLQIMLQLFDPVAEEWHPVFRGHIDDVQNTASPGAPTLTNKEIDCVGIFDYLAGAKMVVGSWGDTYPATAKLNGVVFYEDGPVDGRIEDVLDDAGLDPDMYVVFSGNVDVNESLYDPDDNALQALRDAADAEFPGIANVYEDRFGRVVFHGRFARFDPDTVAGDAGPDAWDFTRWEAATREDVTGTRAQVREFGWNSPRSRIVNTYHAWPAKDELGYDAKPKIVETLMRSDGTSITAYGYHGLEAGDLIIKEHKTNGNTGYEECGLFGDFWVANYNLPRKNVQRVTFKSLWPDDARAAATWDLMCRIDISDILHLWIDEADLSDDEFYVEGIQGEARFLNPDFDMVTVTPNLSPTAYYTGGFPT